MSLPTVSFKPRRAQGNQPATSQPAQARTPQTYQMRKSNGGQPKAVNIDLSSDSDAGELPSISTLSEIKEDIPANLRFQLRESEEESEDDEIKKEVSWQSKMKSDQGSQLSAPDSSTDLHKDYKQVKMDPPEPVEKDTAEPEPINKAEKPTHVHKGASHQTDPFEDLDTYVLIREKLPFQPTKFRLMKGDVPILFSVQTKNDFGKVHLISKEPPNENNANSCTTFLRIQDSSSRFTLVTHTKTQGEERNGEIMGISYISEDGTTIKARQIRIVISKDGEPFYPISKTLNLSRLARTGTTMDRFTSYVSKLPRLNDDGGLSLYFGPAFIITSVKNFIFDDPQTKKPVMMVYKLSRDTFSVRIKAPFDPMMGFAFGIAAVTGTTPPMWS